MITKNILWEKISDEGLTNIEKTADDNLTPWFIKLLLGFVGWLGATFLLAAIGVSIFTIVSAPSQSIFIGIVMCSVSVFAFKKGVKNDFVIQFLIAVTLAGQGLLFYGLFILFEYEDRIVFIIIFVSHFVFYIFINNYILKVFTVLAGMISLLLLISSFNLHQLIPGALLLGTYVLWCKEYEIPFKPIYIQSIGITITALTIVTIFGDGYIWREISNGLIFDFSTVKSTTLTYWMNVFILGVTYFYMLKKQLNFNYLFAICLSIVTSLISIYIPGFVIMLPIILITYDHRNYLVMTLCIVSSLFYLSYYYYQMDITLLAKSIVLMSLGSVFLITRFCLKRKGILCQKN